MYRKVLSRLFEFKKICTENAAYIIKVSDASWKNIDFSQNEPEIIRQYLMNNNVGIDYLNKNLAQILSQRRFVVKFASVYIHQKPIITRESGGKCEIGDLLVIFSFFDRSKNPIINRAFIMQAKKEFKIGNICQQELYENDLKFYFPKNLYKQSLCCNTDSVRYWPKYWENRSRGLKYLILKDYGPIVRFLPWDTQIHAYWSLIFLWTLLGNSALRFSRQPYHPCQNWSAIIWDLITVTGIALTKKQKRGQYINHLMTIVNEFNEFDKFHHYTKMIDGGEGGLPIMLIMVQDEEFKV